MAFPVLANAVSTNISTAATSHTINVGSPSAGDLLIVYARFAADPGTVTFTGYTPFLTDSSDASDDTNIVFYREADGAEGVSDAMSTANSVKLAAIAYVITGAADPASQVPEASTVAIGTTANANSTIVTPAGGSNDYLFLVTLGMDSETATATAPSGYAIRHTANSGTGGAAATNCIIWMSRVASPAAASSEDPGAWTSSAPATGWTAWTIAIYPPVVAGAVDDVIEKSLQAVNRASVW